MSTNVSVIFRTSPSAFTQDELEEMLQYYRDETSLLEEVLEVSNIQVTLVEKKRTVTWVPEYRLTFTMSASSSEKRGIEDKRELAIDLAESIVTPDEDGNHVLKNGECVSGRLLEKTLVVESINL